MFLALVWFLVGCVIAVPYTFLVNGSFDNFFATAWFAPVAVPSLFIAYAMRGVGRRDRSRLKWGDWFFWVVVSYFCLPIILNGVSLLMGWMGYEVISHYAFEGRFVSLLVVPMLMAMMSGIVNGVRSARQWLSGNRITSI